MDNSKVNDRFRRVNDVVAPTGWGEVNLDLPLWRYGLLAMIFAGGWLGFAFMARGWSIEHLIPSDWIFGAAIVAACLVPPLLRRLYLRQKRQRADDR